MAISAGDKVRMHYTAKLEDGTVVDSSEGKDPLEFDAGSDQLIPGVSNAVIGMEMGEKKTVTVSPEQGYGEHHAEAVQQVEKSNFPPEVKVGDMFKAVTPGGEVMVRVTEVDGDNVTVDANHPLAGQTLIFDMEIVE
ncbi:MAG: peptidylprolyl isomerase [Desulfarculaceae bacterium]|nr:peptidylprolyl isomerase [Desulfarculaceae bacterium]MCF8072023.1 peptidylprolyl isomerase [Desulfarculaceae bacterium]MCF8101540.1 peptidylprolyl isomerase [Desulfarculaceae bacterium]MCF8115090.1 peptidylprolyl isomerase [Desulfarculaceae bacterium]